MKSRIQRTLQLLNGEPGDENLRGEWKDRSTLPTS